MSEDKFTFEVYLALGTKTVVSLVLSNASEKVLSQAQSLMEHDDIRKHT